MKPLPHILGVFCGLVVASFARGEGIVLSDLSSDATPPDVLDASLDFSVNGTTLTLTVSNDTGPFGGYIIDRILFNARPNVTGVTFQGSSDWLISAGGSAPTFGGFGYTLRPRAGIDPMYPRDIQVFVFNIAGTPPFSGSDFTTATSVAGPGETPARAAASFINGPGGDSAYGAAAGVAIPALTPVGWAVMVAALLAAGAIVLRRQAGDGLARS